MTTLTIDASGDDYDGDPLFAVDVDGVQVGGPYDVSALYSSGAFQQFTLTGNFDATPSSIVSVVFLNDASGPGGDRNLYVGSVTLNGRSFDGNVAALNTNAFLTNAGALWGDGALSFSLATPSISGLPTTITVGAQPTDPFAGVAISDPASNPSDQAEIIVTAYGAASDANGVLSGAGLTRLSAGTYSLAATTPAALAQELAALAFTPTAGAASSLATTDFEVIASNGAGAGSANLALTASSQTDTTDTIVIEAAGDQYEGDPTFTVDVNGVQVGGPYDVSTLYSSGSFQTFNLNGNFGIAAGSTVTINYTNDASGPGGDRNLYVGSATINGQTYQGSVAAEGTNGVLSNAGALWSDGSLAFTVAPPIASTGQLSLVGVNLSGQEQLSLPDTYPTDAELQYYASKGLNVIRLPIAWERLQPTLGGAFSSYDLQQVQRIVSDANSLGMTVDLDLHNYGSYNSQPIGSSAVPISDFAGFWGQMASLFAGANVMFGLMNEPDLDAQTWLSAQNAAIAAIRAAGATTQTVLVSGVDYDTASTWLSSGNAATYGNAIVDPAKNYAFEVHQYFDSDGSGVGGDTVSATIGEQDLAAVTQWAQQNGDRLFLGEFGANTDSTALANLKNTLSYMAANSNVWLGGTEWEASTLYNYYFNVAPVNGVDSPQIAVLDQFAPANRAATTSLAATAVDTQPVITGLPPNTALTDNTVATPFSGVAVSDPDLGAAISATVTLTASGQASDANGTLTGIGITQSGAGTYALAAASPGVLTAELDALAFHPAAQEVAPGNTVTTGALLSVAEGSTSSQATSTIVTTAAGPPVDSIAIELSEDFYLTDATCEVTINGVQVGGLQTITASHAQGHDDTLTYTGPFGVGAQSVAVTFTNDAYGGSPALDRNLYVNAIMVNGTAIAGTAAPLYVDSTQTFTPALPGTPSGVVAPALGSASMVAETFIAH